jgi:hypothetical protein
LPALTGAFAVTFSFLKRNNHRTGVTVTPEKS